MKKYFLLFLFFTSVVTIAQNIIVLDTTNKEFKTNLDKLYADRNLKTIKNLQSLPDKKVRKQALASYEDLSLDFKQKIKKGIFINESFYATYLQNLIDKISASNPAFSDVNNTTILLSFSESPNAYAIGDHVVVIEIPLLNKLENEYELAFIICHEISHNLLKHTYNTIVNRASFDNSAEVKNQTKSIKKTKFGKGALASNFLKEMVYTNRKDKRRNEHQADSLGTILFKNTFKNNDAIVVQTLKNLEKLDQATDSLSIADYTTLFTTKKQPFKNEWINTSELDKYKYDKTSKFWNIDSLRTHPDAIVRANYIQNHFKIDTLSKHNNVNSEIFTSLKFQAKYHYVLGLYSMENYGKSLYESLLILKNQPENTFVRAMVKSNLEKIIEAQKKYELNKYVDNPNFKNYSNSYNVFLSFIRELRKSELQEILNHYST